MRPLFLTDLYLIIEYESRIETSILFYPTSKTVHNKPFWVPFTEVPRTKVNAALKSGPF